MGTGRTWALLVGLVSAACGGSHGALPGGDAAVGPDAASSDTASVDAPAAAPDVRLPSFPDAGPLVPADGAAGPGDGGLGAEVGPVADGPSVGDGSIAVRDAGSIDGSPDAFSDAGDVGGAPTSCPDPKFPVLCPARSDVPAMCWSAGTACSTVAKCGDQFYSCTTPSAQFVCSEMRCVFTPSGDGGATECGDPNFPVSCPAIRDVPKLCWSSGTVCSTLTRCGSEFRSCLAPDYTYDCASSKCVPTPPGDAGTTGG